MTDKNEKDSTLSIRLLMAAVATLDVLDEHGFKIDECGLGSAFSDCYDMLNASVPGRNFGWRPFPEFGCYCKIEKDTILSVPMSPEGGMAIDAGEREAEQEACEVSAPGSQEFLDAINRQFGTTFTMDMFSGR